MSLRRGSLLALFLTLAAIGLLLWTLAEARNQRRAIEQALASEALLLARSLGPGMAAASHAARELDEIVLWKLLDNARLFAALGPPTVDQMGRWTDLAETNGLDSLVFVDAVGELDFGVGEPFDSDLTTELEPILQRRASELLLGSSLGEERDHLEAAVAMAGGGAVLVRIRSSTARAFAQRLGVENLLSSLVGTGGVLFLSYREDPGDRRVEVSWDGGSVPERSPAGAQVREIRGRSTFEVEVPLDAPAGSRASLRVGLDAAPVRQAAAAATRRTALVGLVLLALAIAGSGVAVLSRLRYRDREEAARRIEEVESARRRSERLAAAGSLTAGLAHEVRSPMNAMGLAAQRLERKLPFGDDRRQIAAQIRVDLRRLDETLTEFLELASPVAERRTRTGIHHVAAEVRQSLEPEAETAGVRLAGVSGRGWAIVDRHAVRRALVNLVRNAIQASPEDSEVSLAIGEDQDAVTVAITDCGPGVDPDIGDRLFDAFVSGRAEGTGLGLSLVRRVAEEHGGGVALANRPGGGAEAILRLPPGEERFPMSTGNRVLVVEDDPSQREMLAGLLEDLNVEVESAADGRSALDLLRRESFDLVITDLRMPEMGGEELLRAVKELNPQIPVVLVTAFGSVASAVEALKEGASDYLLKPLDLDQVEHVVRRCLEERHLRRENRELRRRLGEIESLPGIITAGGEMSRVLSTVARVAASEVSVLVLGESGTGKELIARAIHATSRRSDGPFVAVNAAALSVTLLESELFGHERGAFTGADRSRLGRFEAASGGTLFLDEIGDLPLEVQIKLLRVLQERRVERVGSNRSLPVDVRLVAATHDDLHAKLAGGSFREDLFYRMAVVTIELPPLRRRRADIPLLIDHFLAKHRGRVDSTKDERNGAKAFSRQAVDLLVRYDFPGNVRELENIVQRCLVLARGELISIDDLPPAVLAAAETTAADPLEDDASLPARVAALERSAIEEAVALEGGNQTRAASRLGLSERALRYKRSKYQRA